MARYIDADRLNKDVLASWDKDKHFTLEASRVHRQEHHHLMSIIEKQPTADVVPKSETAREIFAEIERFYDNRQSVYLTRSEFYTIKNKYISEGGEE